MSFLSDLFHGNFSNLGEDIAPQNIFKDFGSSAMNVLKNPIADIGIAAGIAAPFLLPELLPALGVGGGAAAEGGLAAADVGAGAFDLGTIGPGVTEAGTAISGDVLPATSGLTAGTASAFDTGAVATPFTDMTVGGGFPQVTGGVGAGTLDFSPSSVIATGGNVLPDVGATGGAVGYADPSAAAVAAGGGGGAAPDFGYAVYSGGQPVGVQGAAPFAAPGGAEAAAGGGGGVLGSIGSTLKSAAPFLGAAGLGYNLFQGYESQQALKALQNQETAYQNQIAGAGQAALQAAGPMLSTGQALMTGGPVPAPMQAILDNYRNSQRARVIQSYTGQGQSGDPTKNTALAQDLNAVDNQMLALQESVGNQIVTTANQMLASGASATNIAAELPMMMQRLDIALQQQSGNAIANFAAAMSGGTMKVTGQGAGQNINITTGNPLLTG